MEALTAALESLPVSQWMRASRWGYAVVNTLHVTGVALLFGAIVPLDLRLLGCWRGNVALAPLARVLVPVAAAGLALAVASGVLLFLSAPSDYAATPLFLAKMALVTTGAGAALVTHARVARRLARDTDLPPAADAFTVLAQLPAARLRLAGAVSLLAWAATLVCGRMLAFIQ